MKERTQKVVPVTEIPPSPYDHLIERKGWSCYPCSKTPGVSVKATAALVISSGDDTPFVEGLCAAHAREKQEEIAHEGYRTSW